MTSFSILVGWENDDILHKLSEIQKKTYFRKVTLALTLDILDLFKY